MRSMCVNSICTFESNPSTLISIDKFVFTRMLTRQTGSYYVRVNTITRRYPGAPTEVDNFENDILWISFLGIVMVPDMDRVDCI